MMSLRLEENEVTCDAISLDEIPEAVQSKGQCCDSVYTFHENLVDVERTREGLSVHSRVLNWHVSKSFGGTGENEICSSHGLV